MKSKIQACLAGFILIVAAGVLYSQNPALKKGVSVEMPVAAHAAEMRAADQPNATVVAMTADGRVFVGAQPTDLAALSRLSDTTVYLKADARVPYRSILAALDALRGKSVLLLSAPPQDTARRGYVPPYATKLAVSQ